MGKDPFEGCLKTTFADCCTLGACNCGCYGLTQGQQSAFDAVRQRFPELRVSAPAYWYEWDGGVTQVLHRSLSKNPQTGKMEVHHFGTTSIDFSHSSGYHSRVMEAFEYFRRTWPGGVGIGILNADPHLHLDMAGAYKNGRRRVWIEIDKVLGHEIQIGDPSWNSQYKNAQNLYKFWDPNANPGLAEHSIVEDIAGPAADFAKSVKDFVDSVGKTSGWVLAFGMGAFMAGGLPGWSQDIAKTGKRSNERFRLASLSNIVKRSIHSPAGSGGPFLIPPLLHRSLL